MITKFSNNLICIDSINGMNQYDFHLTSLVILIDEYDDSILAAFRISNKHIDKLYEVEWVCVKMWQFAMIITLNEQSMPKICAHSYSRECVNIV